MMKKLFILVIIFATIQCAQNSTTTAGDFHKIVDGVHVRTGLQDDENLHTIIGACTPCHSAQLITQNRATREGWEGMIRWMQESQGLGDLGQAEPVILDYLAKYYAPEETGRRKNLAIADEDWYTLK